MASLFAPVLLCGVVSGLVHDSSRSLPTVGAGGAAGPGRTWVKPIGDFDDFVQRYGRSYEAGSEEYEMRRKLYTKSVVRIKLQNSRSARAWTAGINDLADRTNEELTSLRGYNRHFGPTDQDANPLSFRRGANGTSALAQAGYSHNFPKSFSWVPHLESLADVPDQGICGSSWAVGTVTVLNSHAELHQKRMRFSAQQLLSCTEAPSEGCFRGGCLGGTTELAMNSFMKLDNIFTEELFPYSSVVEPCKTPQEDAVKVTARDFGMKGWIRTPVNDAKAVMEALYLRGPVAVSVASTHEWDHYYAGIMDECSKGKAVNHVMTLVGYGVEEGKNLHVGMTEMKDIGRKYWSLQNSWGRLWGEEGYLRLSRRSVVEEDKLCFEDNTQPISSSCKATQEMVRFCGTCGILFEAVVPDFAVAQGSWWSTHGVSAEV